jgi:hypothetical protein
VRWAPLTSKVEARSDTPDLLASAGTMDRASAATATAKGAVREIKEWQAIMNRLHALPEKTAGELPLIPVDHCAAEIRAIKTG